MSASEVPVDCAICGFFLGSGFPGGTAFCSKCQDYVVTRARTSNLGAVLGALVVVGVGVGLGFLAMKLLNELFE